MHIALKNFELFMYLLKPVFKHVCSGNYQNEIMYQTKTQFSMVDITLSKIHVPSCSHVMAASMRLFFTKILHCNKIFSMNNDAESFLNAIVEYLEYWNNLPASKSI